MTSGISFYVFICKMGASASSYVKWGLKIVATSAIVGVKLFSRQGLKQNLAPSVRAIRINCEKSHHGCSLFQVHVESLSAVCSACLCVPARQAHIPVWGPPRQRLQAHTCTCAGTCGPQCLPLVLTRLRPSPSWWCFVSDFSGNRIYGEEGRIITAPILTTVEGRSTIVRIVPMSQGRKLRLGEVR